jgi:hypothetical protein
LFLGDFRELAGLSPTELWTKDVPASWFMIDLGPGRSVVPTFYTLRHGGNYRADSLRNWDFQVMQLFVNVMCVCVNLFFFYLRDTTMRRKLGTCCDDTLMTTHSTHRMPCARGHWRHRKRTEHFVCCKRVTIAGRRDVFCVCSISVMC